MSRRPVSRAISIASRNPFSGAIRPTKQKSSPSASASGGGWKVRPWWMTVQSAVGARLVPADSHQPAPASVEGIARPRQVEPPVKGGHDWNPRAPGELQVPRIDMGVDKIETVLLLEDHLERPAARRGGVVAEPDRPKGPWDRRNESARHPRIAAREGRDLVATPIELTNPITDDPLGSPVTDRRDGLQGRSDLGDPQRLAGPTPCPGAHSRTTTSNCASLRRTSALVSPRHRCRRRSHEASPTRRPRMTTLVRPAGRIGRSRVRRRFGASAWRPSIVRMNIKAAPAAQAWGEQATG